MLTLGERCKTHGWFILLNGFLFSLLATSYFNYLPDNQALSTWAYVAVATIGQMCLLAALVGLITLPLVLIRKQVIRALLTALIFTMALITLYVDTQVFAQYRFHIRLVLVEMILSGGIVEFSKMTYAIVTAAVIATLAVQYGLYIGIDNRASQYKIKLGRRVSYLVLLALISTHISHIWANANAILPITNISRFLPLFYPATANSLLQKYGLVDEQALAEQKTLKLKQKSTLNYPLTPLEYQAVKPKNIVFIVIDSWRADSFSQAITPNMWQFAQQGEIYQNHYSTGNATRAGIFGLFYGLPATYWHSFYSNRQAPILMDRLQQLDYQLGIFASAHLLKPEFHQTVFVNVPDLRVRSKSETMAGRDIEITDEWLAWDKQRDQHQPAFSFLFYDSPHGYTFPKDYPYRIEPQVAEVNYLTLNEKTDPQPIINRYNNSVHFNDSLIGKVLKQIKDKGELDNTLVIITGDHGQEINDNKLNFWGHNSNFTDAQIKVPFIALGAGIKPAHNQHISSHMDVAPGILKQYLGLSNPIAQYSSGEDIFNVSRSADDWLILASYNEYAIVDDKGILQVSGYNGNYQLMDRHNQPKQGRPDFTELNQAYSQMNRYLK